MGPRKAGLLRTLRSAQSAIDDAQNAVDNAFYLVSKNRGSDSIEFCRRALSRALQTLELARQIYANIQDDYDRCPDDE